MAAKRHFAVERLNWREHELPTNSKVRLRALLPGSQRVSCFDDPDKADADGWRREAEARRGVNPFSCGSAFCYLSSLDEGRLGDWVQDIGLTPPEKSGLDAWRAWWDENEPQLSELQRAKVWEALDKVRFFRVVEVPRRILFVVAGAYWHYNDEYYYRNEDGLTPYDAFRTREDAEADCRDNEEFARDEMEIHPFQINGLCDWDAWSSLPQDEAVKRVKEMGLEPPGPPRYGDTLDWGGWYDSQDLDWEQEAAVWDMLDKIRFYEVVEVEYPD